MVHEDVEEELVEEEEESSEDDEQDQEQPEEPASTHPPLLGTILEHCVAMSFYTLAGTAFGKFITCVGKIEPVSTICHEQVLRVANDEYRMRDITLQGYFMEKMLDPHADQNATPRAEEGTWKASRRTRSFHMDAMF